MLHEIASRSWPSVWVRPSRVTGVAVEPGERGLDQVVGRTRLDGAGAVSAAEPDHLDRGAARPDGAIALDALPQREKGVDRALHDQGGDPDAPDEVAGVAAGEPLL